MILSGKCKEAFVEWSKDKGIDVFYAKDYSLNIAKTIHNAILIEFFDSVGIYIEIEYTNTDIGIVFDVSVNKEWVGCTYETRQEAINAAIVKANEIFNNR